MQLPQPQLRPAARHFALGLRWRRLPAAGRPVLQVVVVVAVKGGRGLAGGALPTARRVQAGQHDARPQRRVRDPSVQLILVALKGRQLGPLAAERLESRVGHAKAAATTRLRGRLALAPAAFRRHAGHRRKQAAVGPLSVGGDADLVRGCEFVSCAYFYILFM